MKLTCPNPLSYRYLIAVGLMLLLTTRTMSSPPSYWQQDVNYEIQVTLDDQNHRLNGDITIDYTNNSPDTLHKIFMHLWPNAYRNNQTAFAHQKLEAGNTEFYYANESKKGYIDKVDFQVDGEFANWSYHPDHIDIAKIKLSDPLLPGESIKISTGFMVKIPYTFSRMGHVGQTYQITQWYPKPAVYDKKGWHPMPYLDQGEFYSEYGSFDVKITLPENYVVGATGVLQNEKERQWLNKKARKWEGGNQPDPLPGSIPSSGQTKTLHYKAQNVHDFAWFASKRYYVQRSKVTLPRSGDKVTTWTMFPPEQKETWENSTQYVDSSVYYYSKWVGDYPYPHATAVAGDLKAGGGMEYPMITVISQGGSKRTLERVIAHEVGHNWFYGILGTNERAHTWMDEGLNSYYEQRYMRVRAKARGEADTIDRDRNLRTQILSALTKGNLSASQKLIYQIQAYRHKEQPISIGAAEFTRLNYLVMNYIKIPIMLQYMEAAIGKEEVDHLMHQFFNEWKFQHPHPDDMREVFTSSGHEMSWFFDHVITTTWTMDYALTDVSDDTVQIGGRGFRQLTVDNRGGIKGPSPISAMKDGEVVETVWYGGFPGKMKVLFPDGNYDKFRLDAKKETPDIKRTNNTIKVGQPFSACEWPQVRMLLQVENDFQPVQPILPIVGWNNYDKTMIGLGFYNSFLLPKNFEYFIGPMFGFGSKDWTGMGHFAYYFYPNHSSLFESIEFSMDGKSFTESYYTELKPDDPSFYNRQNRKYYKIMPSVTFRLTPPTPRTPLTQKVQLRHIQIFKDQPACLTDPDIECAGNMQEEQYMISEIGYSLDYDKAVNPYGFDITAQGGSQFAKLFGEFSYQLDYNDEKSLEIRAFGGSFLFHKNPTADVRFRLGSYGGQADYEYDHTFFDRHARDPVFGQQIAEENGGFRTISALGQTSQWLAALNLTSDIPGTNLLQLYADVGSYAGADQDNQPIAYNAGIALTPINNLLEIYFPVAFRVGGNDIFLMSDGLRDNLKSTTGNYWQRITFRLNLRALRPFKRVRYFRARF